MAAGDFFVSDDTALMYNKLVCCIPAIKKIIFFMSQANAWYRSEENSPTLHCHFSPALYYTAVTYIRCILQDSRGLYSSSPLFTMGNKTILTDNSLDPFYQPLIAYCTKQIYEDLKVYRLIPVQCKVVVVFFTQSGRQVCFHICR